MDYDSGEEDALGMQLRLSPELPSFNTLRNMHAPLGFNKEDNQELPTEVKDDEEDEDEVEELPNPKRSRPKVVYGGGGPPRSSGRLIKKTLKAASQIGNQNMHKSTLKRSLKRPSNASKSAARKSRPLEPPISDIKASNNSIREVKKTPTKASKRRRKELNSSLAPAIATFLINIVVLFNNKKLLILSSVKKSNNLLFGLIAINKQEGAEKYAKLQGFDTHFIKRTILIEAPDGLGLRAVKTISERPYITTHGDWQEALDMIVYQ
jgi:hypothetical protein